MLEAVSHLFAVVCGQNPEHTWAPGGIVLPCCQRCTGLYVGACLAGLLHWWLRPGLTARFLELHGAFLTLMAPFGFHWLPQGPFLRTVTGVLFGFAVTTFLWLPLSGPAAQRSGAAPSLLSGLLSGNSRAYLLIVAVATALLPLLADRGGRLAAGLLTALAGCGLGILVLLLLANMGLLLVKALQCLRRARPNSSQP